MKVHKEGFRVSGQIGNTKINGKKHKSVFTLLFVRMNLFVNLHHCTKEYLHLAPPIFLYAKVDSAGGR